MCFLKFYQKKTIRIDVFIIIYINFASIYKNYSNKRMKSLFTYFYFYFYFTK